MALSAKWYTYPDRFHWIEAHDFAIEYSPDPKALDLLPQHVDTLLDAGVPVRYHGFFRGYEFAHQDPVVARRGMEVHRAALEAMQGRGEQVITFHVGLNRDDPLDSGRAMENLGKLVMRAQELGIIVCLENLRRGLTSDPETVLNWAKVSGSMITLDIGHAVSCQRVESGELSVIDFVNTFADRLHEVHMYEREVDRHYPPQDMRILGPIVDRLLTTSCNWWTIELDDYAEALYTRNLLLGHLSA